jgi:hypothetical protein
MLHHVDYVDEPDVKQKFEVIRGIGNIPPTIQLLSNVKTCAKIWMANHVVQKAVEIATAAGRVQEVKVPSDIPTMWERGLLFTSPTVRQQLIDVAHHEVTWVDHHIQIRNKAIMLQLKDFSFAAQVSFAEVRDDVEPMGEDVLIRREARLKFGLDAEQAIIYQLPEDWLHVEIEKIIQSRR